MVGGRDIKSATFKIILKIQNKNIYCLVPGGDNIKILLKYYEYVTMQK